MKKLLLFILLVCATVQAYSQEYPKVILSGDYPDPSVMRDGEDYYMTHSPFYYAPGFLIWHSRDLMNWEPVCRVMPEYEGSVISDLKGELYQMTAGWREKYGNQRVLRFEPAALTGSVRWNPLDEIRLEPEYEIADVQNLAGMLTDPDGKGQDGPSRHWIVSSQSLLVGLILHVLYKARNEGTHASLATIDALVSENKLDDAFWDRMKRYGHRTEEGASEKVPHPIVVRVAQDMLNTPEKEREALQQKLDEVLK